MSEARVIVCCGVGGVGKTTAAAAVAVGHALAGHRVVVLTIDPARRLADALGLAGLGNDPQPVDLAELGYEGPGGLHALMLDQKATFDEVIRRFSPDEETADSLTENRYYRAVSERLGGSHEYMAMVKLHGLVEDGRWDIVVVDTPPTQHALDFFRAPERLRRLFDKSMLRVLVRPGRGLLAVTTRRVVRLINRLAGANVMTDIGEFFQLFGRLSKGFNSRSVAVRDLLHSDRTRYFLVTSASAPARTDALSFLGVLQAERMTFAGFLVNRVQRDTGIQHDLSLSDFPEPPAGIEPGIWWTYAESLVKLVETAQAGVERHRDSIALLLAKDDAALVWTVPDQAGGVRTLTALAEMSRSLPPNDASLGEWEEEG